ncbi:hypothetical protein, partial [Neorhizobium galegae]|uniref:hypothetical protein n=1 Tax=Neorhizobium galegae TaxID=399 RepID=UPI00210400B4
MLDSLDRILVLKIIGNIGLEKGIERFVRDPTDVDNLQDRLELGICSPVKRIDLIVEGVHPEAAIERISVPLHLRHTRVKCVQVLTSESDGRRLRCYLLYVTSAPTLVAPDVFAQDVHPGFYA